MSHTPELYYAVSKPLPDTPFPMWTVQGKHGELRVSVSTRRQATLEASRLNAAYQQGAKDNQGCAGLNPSAYRECVEALKAIANLPYGNLPTTGMAAKMASMAKQVLSNATQEASKA